MATIAISNSVPVQHHPNNPAPRIRPPSYCPRHQHLELIPVGGAARGICPADGATHQMEAPEAVICLEDGAR
jgi:hypothetical protein